MRTHTIRNKSSQPPIVTITEGFLKRLTSASEWAAAVTISKLLGDLKNLTGKDYKLDSASTEELGRLQYLFDEKYFMVRRLFVDGLMAGTPMPSENVLNLCNDLDNCLQ